MCIPFFSFLITVILCELVLYSFRGCSENCVVFVKGGVCSWRIQDHHFGVLFVIKVWLLSEFSVVAEDWM